MARIRSIKPEFFTSEQIADCSPLARFLFIGMWCFCDDNGVHPAAYKTLKMEVFPSDPISADEIKRLVEELLGVGLLDGYAAEGKEYLIVTGWRKHQKIEKPTCRHPLPDGSPNSRRGLRNRSGTESSRVESSRGRAIQEEEPLSREDTHARGDDPEWSPFDEAAYA